MFSKLYTVACLVVAVAIGFCQEEPADNSTKSCRAQKCNWNIAFVNPRCFCFGDPHCITIDRKKIDYMGTCKYIAMANRDAPGLPPFTVFAKNELRPDVWGGVDRQLSFIKYAEVQVFGKTIRIYNKNGETTVDGQKVPLPYFYPPAPDNDCNAPCQFHIHRIGLFGLQVNTEFGLVIWVDGEDQVSIVAPPQLKDHTGGVCAGNWDGNQDNDMTKMDGQVTQDHNDFGSSWIIHDQEDQNCLRTARPENCEPANAEKGQKFCAQLVDMNGLLGPCLKNNSMLEEAKGKMGSCVWDTCMGNGQESIAFRAVSTFAKGCNLKMGLNIDITSTGLWTVKQQCPDEMVPSWNASVAAKRCENLHSGGSNLKLYDGAAIQGCVCKDGFLFDHSKSKCVKPEECPAPPTQPPPRPQADPNATDCRASKCNWNSAFVNPRCFCFGDPHCITIDGKKVDYMGSCKYIAMANKGAPGIPQFTVFAKNEYRNEIWGGVDRQLSFIKYAEVQLFGRVVRIAKGGVLTIDGIKVSAPYFYPPSPSKDCNAACKFHVHRVGLFGLQINTEFGLVIFIDGDQVLSIAPPPGLKGHTGGVCAGNWDGKQDNDFTKMDGSIAKDVNDFGSSWVVQDPEDTSCVRTARPESCTSEATATARKFCGQIKDKSGVFAPCFANEAIAKSAEHEYNACVFDTCMANGQEKIAFKEVSAFATTCSLKLNIKIDIKSTGLWTVEPECPVDMVFSPSASVAMKRCENSKSGGSQLKLYEGSATQQCVCKEGLLYSFSLQKCVPPDQCPPPPQPTLPPPNSQNSDDCQLCCQQMLVPQMQQQQQQQRKRREL